MDVYLTGGGSYLPGPPRNNDELGFRLGPVQQRILAANGIQTRHYAEGELNEDLAAHAIEAALKDRGISIDKVQFLATGTTQGDYLVPGFASMVHGRLAAQVPMELLSAGGVCASGMAALAGAARAIRTGDHDTAVVVGSELVSRSLKRLTGAHLDAEFLKWTLSDGAGAVVLEKAPRPTGISLRLDWVHNVSHAHEHPVCMSAELPEDGGYPQLRQDVSLLPQLFNAGAREFAGLARKGLFRPSEVDHLLCHYSAERFRSEILNLMRETDTVIDESRWFSNLTTRGNTGAASVFVMLADAWPRFKPGDRIVLAVPESGRFSFSFAHLTAVSGDEALTALAGVWEEFERHLAEVPLVQRIQAGTASIADYRRLLVHLRQQVIEGSRWITRAASHLSHPELRSYAIKHAAEEHLDYLMLERDFCAVGGTLDEIRNAPKNVGSEALSAFIFQQASRPDPVDLLGAVFIIEGLGTRLALGWAQQLQEHLGLRDDQVSFIRYHGESDDAHFAEMAEWLRSEIVDVHGIVRTARIVARLYALQLTELS